MDGSGVEVLFGINEVPPAEEAPWGAGLVWVTAVQLVVDSAALVLLELMLVLVVLLELMMVLLPVEEEEVVVVMVVVEEETEALVLDALLVVSLAVEVIVPLLADVVVSTAGTEIG